MLATTENPLGRVFDMESTSGGRGLLIGLAAALLIHIAGAAEAARVGNGVGGWARDTRTSIHAVLSRLYDIEMVNAPPPPPPEPEPEAKEPEPVKPAAPAPKAAPAPRDNQPPPAPAQAGKIITQEPDPEAPVDLTGEGFVTGTAETYAGGVSANTGTSKTAVRNLGAAVGGTPGGTGAGHGTGNGTGSDLSRPASLAGSSNWSCPFPPEADAEQIDFQRVQIAVTVRADGTAQDVKVIGDPGHGFGRAARQCALRQRYNPPLDRQGNPVTGTMPPIFVRFNR